MYSKAKVLGHPMHPMLVAFPIVFYVLTFVGFAVYQFGSQDLFWYRLGYFSNFAGVGTAILAAIPGFIDWAYGIPTTSAAKTRGLWHALYNVGALLLFILTALHIRGSWDVPVSVGSVVFVSFLGVALTAIAGFHGWELVATHKVGVSLTPEQIRLEPTDKIDRVDHEGGASIRPRPRAV